MSSLLCRRPEDTTYGASQLVPQHIVRAALDRFRDRVAVRRSEAKRPENQEVQRPLQQLDASVISSGRHPRC